MYCGGKGREERSEFLRKRGCKLFFRETADKKDRMAAYLSGVGGG